MEHRPVNGKNTKKKKINIPMIVISIINLLFTILTVAFVISLKMVPMKFIVLFVILLLGIDVGAFFLLRAKSKISKIIGYILSGITILICSVGMFYIAKTNNFLDKAFNNGANYYTSSYYILVLGESEYENINDLDGATLGYYVNIPNIEEALDELENDLSFEKKELDDLYDMFDTLNDELVDSVIIDKALYSTVSENTSFYDMSNYRVVYEFDVKIKEEIEEINTDSDSFSIYIGGADFTELYNDFNMIVTINKKTHKILLTSTPRDYYVNIHGKGGKDLLGYAAVWGINTSRKTLEDLYGINIDYYLKINTQSLVGLVDTLGGVEFCSDISFKTSHALVMGTYDDTKGQKLFVQSGCREYSGIEILTIARERLAFKDGDRQRQKNCQQIMINIFKKMIRPELLTNYTNILNAVSSLYTTNVPRELVSELATETLNGAQWSFEQQSVTGSDSRGNVHFSSVVDYVMKPNQESLDAAHLNIKKIEEGR